MRRHILQAGFRFRCFNALDDPARSNGGDRSGDLDGRVAIPRVWRTRAEKAQATNAGAKIFDDHRKLLEMPGLEAVIIATSDHWHAAIAIGAANAGKDLHVEKPLTRTVEEGQQVVQALRMNNRICQMGAQQRSGSHYMVRSTVMEEAPVSFH